MKIGFLVLFVSSLFLFTNATSCYAIYGNSTNYEMPISNINFYCSDEHSTNYNVDLSFVDQWVGTNGSAHYNGSFGFYGAVNYTGYSTGGPFDISINAPASVTASSTVTADVQLINQNPGFGEDAFLEYWIIDSSNKNIGSGSKTVYVGAPTTVETMVSLTAPSTTGTYTYVARVTWSTVYTANASDTFTVTSAPGGGDGGGDGGGGASGTRYVPVLMITEYPKNISLERSDFGHYVVEVSNIGGATAVNAFLQILNLSQCCFFSIEPDGINIEKNTSESFALRINVPQDAALGSYNFSIKAIGGSASNEVNSQLNVMEIVQKDVRIVDIYPETLQVNEIGFVRVFVNNTGFEDANVTIYITVPDSWNMENVNETKVVSAGQQDYFDFCVVPEEIGAFEIIVSMSYDGKMKTKIAAIAVKSFSDEQGFALLLIVIIIIVIVIMITTGMNLLFRKGNNQNKHSKQHKRR